MRRIRSCMLGRSVVGLRVDGTSIADKPRDVEIELGIEFVGLSRRAARTRSVRARLDCVAGHIGLELANVALTRRDLHRSLLGVREKSLVRKCSVNPRSSPEITKNRHFRVRVLPPQPRSPVSTGSNSGQPRTSRRARKVRFARIPETLVRWHRAGFRRAMMRVDTSE